MTVRMPRLTLRVRLMAIGLVGLAIATGAGSIALYGLLWFTGLHTLDRNSTATAAEVVGLVQANRLPQPIPVAGAQIVQVVDAQDRVLSASSNADELTALLQPAEVRKALSGPVEVSGSRLGLSGSLRVTAVRATAKGEVVVVAQQLNELHQSARILQNSLLFTFPVLLVALGLIAWRVIGATLRPVEELRSTAERISGAGRDERLPVRGSGDEVDALAVTLNSMLDRLGDSRARQRSFVADVAHELRSPLASMRTQLEVAERLGEGSALTINLHRDVMRMSALVEDLLTLARLDADAVLIPPSSPLDVTGLLVTIAGRYVDPQVPISLEPATGRVWATGDSDELARVVGNLVENALRHATGKVVLSATLEHSRAVTIRVDDDGPGIEADDRVRVLERFTRLDQARDRDAGGSGLGLAIVTELVRRRGGDVRLTESPYGGLRVEVTLPASPDQKARPGRGLTVTEPSPKSDKITQD
jgi:signal transduction histidine kinase